MTDIDPWESILRMGVLQKRLIKETANVLELLDTLDFFLNRSFGRSESIKNNLLRIRSAVEAKFCKKDRFILNSIPKAGTHLLQSLVARSGVLRNSGYFFSDVHHGRFKRTLASYERSLERILGRGFAGCHMPHSKTDAALLRDHGLRMVLLIRDPRDVLVSQYYHCLTRPTNRAHSRIVEAGSFRAGAELLLQGFKLPPLRGMPVPAVAPFEEYYKSYLPWISDENAYLVRYEDLLGADRGGNDEQRTETLQQLLSHLNGDLVDSNIIRKTIARASSSKSNTLRIGKVGYWRIEQSMADVEFIEDRMHSLVALAKGCDTDHAC